MPEQHQPNHIHAYAIDNYCSPSIRINAGFVKLCHIFAQTLWSHNFPIHRIRQYEQLQGPLALGAFHEVITRSRDLKRIRK